jgi:hypothetical protein
MHGPETPTQVDMPIAPRIGAAQEETPATETLPGRRGKWLTALFDLVVVIVLFSVALPLRWNATKGDFWLDEADYAVASVRGFEANRWDLPEPDSADRIIRLRHYHPPLIAQVMGAAARWDRNDRTLRVPSVIAGSLTVSLLYVCGLFLFAPRGDPTSHWAPRFVGLASALALLPAPAHIRASSHALPWPFITLWLLTIALTIAAYGKSRHPAWLVTMGGALGLLFATSEYVVVAALAVALVLPILLWSDFRDRARWGPVSIGLLGGAVLLFVVAYALWPAGLTGGIVTMLRHYVDMADAPWPLVIGDTAYDRAPKWAYAYWYATIYPAQTAWYLLGAIGILVLALMRKLTVGIAGVLLFTGVILAAAHKSHIIGPEYLVHALPLLSLIGGLPFVALAQTHRAVAAILAIVCGAAAALGPVKGILSGMDSRSQISRWPAAAQFLKSRWTPESRMLAPAFGGGGRWYLIYGAGVPVEEWRVQALPAARAKERLIREIKAGDYRFIVTGSTYNDWASVDNSIRHTLAKWPIVWRSDEGGTGPSRLVIYQAPVMRGNRWYPFPPR